MVSRCDIKFVIYGKPKCPNCNNAKSYCEAQSIVYEYKELDVDFTRDEILSKFKSARTFPIVTLDNNWIGGYHEMMDLHKNLLKV